MRGVSHNQTVRHGSATVHVGVAGSTRGSTLRDANFQGVKSPWITDSPEDVCPSIQKPKPRADDKFPDCAGHEHLARVGDRTDPCADVDRNAYEVALFRDALARMNSGPDFKAERSDSLVDNCGPPESAAWGIECSEESVAGVLDLPGLERA
jgi:hypothetical protein